MRMFINPVTHLTSHTSNSFVFGDGCPQLFLNTILVQLHGKRDLRMLLCKIQNSALVKDKIVFRDSQITMTYVCHKSQNLTTIQSLTLVR